MNFTTYTFYEIKKDKRVTTCEWEAFYLISKKIWISGMASIMILGLAACNNDDNAAIDRDNRYGTMNARDNDLNTRRIFDRDDRITRTQNRFNDRDNQYDFYNRNRNDRNDDRFDGLEISSNSTNTPSNKFPHTSAVLVREAKFKYITVGDTQGRNRGRRHARNKTQNQNNIPPLNIVPPAPAPVTPTPRPATPAPAAPTPKPTAPTTQAPAQGISQAAARVIELTNVQRRQNGLPDLKADTQLSGVAQKKSVDMKQNNYFSHTSPTYGSPFDMMRDFGVTYKTAGENIAQGQQTPEQVVDAWMKSQGHRENILSPKYTHIGVGYEAGGHHWTQMFIGK